MPTNLSPESPIGVFDSGIGGLTVAASLRRLLPNESILYIGDTARVPYGGKSRETVERYSIEIGNMLLRGGAKMVVVACNTASALGVPRMKEVFGVPVLGVVDPGAQAAVDSTKNKTIGVIGTRATIASGAYEKAIHALEPSATIHSAPCPLLVPLIEEGLIEDSVTDQMLARYLDPLLSQGIDTLVLGCTHYPLLKNAIARIVGPAVSLVDSAENCARAVGLLLTDSGLSSSQKDSGQLEVALTDSAEGFLRTAAKALELPISKISLQSTRA
ncbi:MAG: glutamate racemase [Terrimicrobiaceae bacterium]